MANDDIETLLEEAGEYGLDSNLVKRLRKIVSDQRNTIKDLETEKDSLSKTVRSRTVKDTLASQGYNPKLAALIPADVQGSEESLVGWLGEYGELFGGARTQVSTEVDGAEGQQTPATDANAVDRMHSLENALGTEVPVTVPADLQSRIQNAATPKELEAVLKSANMRINL